MNDATLSTADELLSAIADLLVKYKEGADARAAAALTTPKSAPSPTYDTPPPWAGATGKGPTTNMTPDGELAAKMAWIAKNMPGGISMRQLVLDATEKYVNELIALHYKQ